jgi:hypothetical protein
MLSTDWVEIRPMRRQDMNMMRECDIFYSCTASILYISAATKPEKKLYLDYFVTKGI